MVIAGQARSAPFEQLVYLLLPPQAGFWITQSIAPVQVTSVQSSCDNGYSTPNGLGAAAQ